MKILVVHRQESVAKCIKSSMGAGESVIRYFNSGLDGLHAIRVELFDLIVSGTDLPIVTGFELIRSLRTQSINEKTPVIFVADEIDVKAKYLGHALGVAGLLTYADVSSGHFSWTPVTNN